MGPDDRVISPASPWAPANVAVVVPIKSFDTAKERLAEALSAAERAELARSMAAVVVAAARPLPVFVVCGDEAVAAWADEHDAEVLWFTEPGLNPAAGYAERVLSDRGFTRVVIAHGDLPRATELGPVVLPKPGDDSDVVIIVRDRRADGTNVLSLPADRNFAFHYGAGSADAHRLEAEQRGLPVRIVDDDNLGWDIDMPDDLLALTDRRPPEEEHDEKA